MSTENGAGPERVNGDIPAARWRSDDDPDPLNLSGPLQELYESLRREADRRGTSHRVPGAEIIHAEESLQARWGDW